LGGAQRYSEHRIRPTGERRRDNESTPVHPGRARYKRGNIFWLAGRYFRGVDNNSKIAKTPVWDGKPHVGVIAVVSDDIDVRKNSGI